MVSRTACFSTSELGVESRTIIHPLHRVADLEALRAPVTLRQINLTGNTKRTYHASIVIKEAMMRDAAIDTLLHVAELVALGAFLTMIGLAARAFGA